MAITTIDGKGLSELLTGGLANLRKDHKRIDELNVFPVPDGDTGSNMLMTLEGGINAVANDTPDDVDALMKKFSRGALLGARGNSGVILSQFIKGFAIGCEGQKTLGIPEFRFAYKSGVERAYDAVIKPTEGTILTVMREGGEYIEAEGSNITNFQDYFSRLIKRMQESLENTPNLLPVLKEAGVIDSGGAGFIVIFEGMEKVLNGEKAEDITSDAAASRGGVNPEAFNADSELEFGYCTEFILQLQNRKVNINEFGIGQIVGYLETIGNSIVAVKDDDLVKVHVHTFTPGKVLNYCQNFGEYITLKIENMSIQHNETSLFKESEKADNKPDLAKRKDIAVVAVTPGAGIRSYFEEIGADICVDGGQTENPSTADFIQAFGQLDAKHIIVLPCNSNIVMAAQQAADLYDKAKVHVIKAKTIPQAYAALSMMNTTDGDIDRIVAEMESNMKGASTGLITTSIRDVDYENVSVKKGDYIGLDDERVVSDSPDKLSAVRDLLNGMEGVKDKEVLTVFFGADVDEDELGELSMMLDTEFSWMEYGFIPGGQEVYDYIFAVE